MKYHHSQRRAQPDASEAADWFAASDAHGLDRIFLVSPSSTDERIAMTTANCRGFVYATAVMGVTGARESSSDLAGPLVARTRATTDLPVGVGLGMPTLGRPVVTEAPQSACGAK